MEGSLHIVIRNRISEKEGSNASPVFCKKCQAIVNALPVSLGFTNSKLHRRILMFAAYVKYWTIYHFSHSCKQRHLLAICLSDPSFSYFRFGGIPPFCNSYLEGSLISEIVKTPHFLQDFGCFLSCFLPFHGQFVCEMPLLQKKLVHWTFSSRESADCKVPPHIGGHHFLLCQQTNTKDIAG